jgi:hypothetical protein
MTIDAARLLFLCFLILLGLRLLPLRRKDHPDFTNPDFDFLLFEGGKQTSGIFVASTAVVVMIVAR